MEDDNVVELNPNEGDSQRDFEDIWNDWEADWDAFDSDMVDWDMLIHRAPSGQEIHQACDEIKLLLLDKNIAYGNSALDPIGIFAKAGAAEGIANRIDDKLNRIKNSQSYPGDNDIDDLIGYLILYKISKS